MNKTEQKKLLIEIMQQDEKDGLYYNKAHQDFREWYSKMYDNDYWVHYYNGFVEQLNQRK